MTSTRGTDQLDAENPWPGLDAFEENATRFFHGRDGDRSYVFLSLEDGGGPMSVGFRKLGMAHLKGLEKLAVYEILDGAEMAPAALTEIRTGEGLAAAVEREFAKTERWQHA